MKRLLAAAFATTAIHSPAYGEGFSESFKKALDQVSDESFSYLVDFADFDEAIAHVESLVWSDGDERLQGYCFGSEQANIRFRGARDAVSDWEDYPVSYRILESREADSLYKRTKALLPEREWRNPYHSEFRSKIAGQYFGGCVFSWSGSFGGGDAALYQSLDGSLKFGWASSWSE